MIVILQSMSLGTKIAVALALVNFYAVCIFVLSARKNRKEQ